MIKEDALVTGEIEESFKKSGLGLPIYQGLVELAGFVQLVKLELTQNSELVPNQACHRVLSRIIYTGCTTNSAQAWQWLGEDLYRHFIVAVDNPADAEELTSESLLIVFQKAGSVKAPEAFISWARGTARNLLRRFYRDSTARRRVSASASTGEQDPETGLHPSLEQISQEQGEVTETVTAYATSSPEQLVLTTETLKLVLAKIRELGQKNSKRARVYEQILLDTYFRELGDPEIAHRLNLPVQEIQKLRSHALKLLRSDVSFIRELRNE